MASEGHASLIHQLTGLKERKALAFRLSLALGLSGIALFAAFLIDLGDRSQVSAQQANNATVCHRTDNLAGLNCPEPTTEPTQEPTTEPTQEPTTEPTQESTTEPTQESTTESAQQPTSSPIEAATQQATAEVAGAVATQGPEVVVASALPQTGTGDYRDMGGRNQLLIAALGLMLSGIGVATLARKPIGRQ